MFLTIKRSCASCQTSCVNWHSISNMMKKFFKVHKLAPFSHKVPPKVTAVPTSSQPESSSALKIVHAGGYVECYYMAIPAVRILEKYPSCILARPEVFRQPWDSVVRSDGILTPGEKFFLVSRRTVKKLQRRVRKPYREVSSNSFVSKPSIDVSVNKVSCKKDDFSSKSFCQQSEANDSTDKCASSSSKASKKKTAVKKHVRFVGIDNKFEADPQSKSLNSTSHGVKKRPGNSPAAWQWQPSLTAICERTDE